jgi:glycosyltransferase involved in cell wall biosynthesis
MELGLPSAGVYTSEEFAAELQRALRRTDYDVVHIDSMNLVQYARLIYRSAVVLSVTDAVSLGYFRNARCCHYLLKRIEYNVAGRIIRDYERRAYKNSIVHVVSRVDRQYLQKLCPAAGVEVVELAVDPAYLRDSPTIRTSRKVITIPESVSAPGVAQRVSAFLAVTCPLLLSFNGGGVIQIIGQGATREFLRAIERYPNVRYYPRVEDYRAALRESDVGVFLEEGGAGTKNRMLQAMALGIPLVVSPAVAGGVAGCDSRPFLVCHTLPEFATAILNIFQIDALARTLAGEAKRFVSTHHTLASVSAQWEKCSLRAVTSDE